MKSAGVRSELREDSIVFFLCGEIDHHSAKYLRERIDAEIYFFHPKKVVLELSEVGFMDSAGLGLILGRYTKSKDLGADFSLLDPSDDILRIVSMAGADKLFSIERSSENVEKKKRERLVPKREVSMK